MPEPVSRAPLVLIANAHEWAARSLDSILVPHGYAVVQLSSGQQVLEQVQSIAPDALLLDAALPDIRGVDVCERLRSQGIVDRATPILLTGQGAVTREQRLQALRAGAWDCIPFPPDTEELLLKLETFLRAKFEVDAVREASLVDPLTGLYTARGLLRKVRELGSDADRHHRALGCVALAPEPGPEGEKGNGTDALRRLAELLHAQARGSDAIGRLGRNEFVILAPETDATAAFRIAERLTRAASTPTHPGRGRPLRLRAGYYAVDDFHAAGMEPVELMVRATLALRRAQAEPGGRRIRFYEPGAGPV